MSKPRQPEPDPIVAYREFTDGSLRPIFEDDQGQYVLDDNGLREYGVYFIPPEECPGAPRGIIADGV